MVRTTADERLDEIREKVQSALEALSEIVIQECPGTESFRRDFLDRLNEAFTALREVRRKLKPVYEGQER